MVELAQMLMEDVRVPKGGRGLIVQYVLARMECGEQIVNKLASVTTILPKCN